VAGGPGRGYRRPLGKRFPTNSYKTENPSLIAKSMAYYSCHRQAAERVSDFLIKTGNRYSISLSDTRTPCRWRTIALIIFRRRYAVKKKRKKRSPFVAIIAVPDPIKSLEECNRQLKELIKSMNKKGKKTRG